jgi:hypothetical protein
MRHPIDLIGELRRRGGAPFQFGHHRVEAARVLRRFRLALSPTFLCPGVSHAMSPGNRSGNLRGKLPLWRHGEKARPKLLKLCRLISARRAVKPCALAA